MKRDEEERINHPSYGMIGLYRVSNSGGKRLFGSSLEQHHHSVRLRVSPGTLIRERHGDRYYGSLSGEILELELSAAQFADLLTTMNIGSGVPCTILARDGQSIEAPPAVKTETQSIKHGFRETLAAEVKRTRAARREVDALLLKLTGKAREQARIALDVMEQALEGNIPWIVERFHEATTRLTTAAKAEVDAFVNHLVVSTGIAALRAPTLPDPDRLPYTRADLESAFQLAPGAEEPG